MCLRWKSREGLERKDQIPGFIPNYEDVLALTGIKRRHPVAVAEIDLNAEKLLLMPYKPLMRQKEIWTVMLHEMLVGNLSLFLDSWEWKIRVVAHTNKFE